MFRDTAGGLEARERLAIVRRNFRRRAGADAASLSTI
jgi:hypothetical protein